VTSSIIKPTCPSKRAIVAATPAWVSEEILSASEKIGDQRAVLWISEN
jgi:hypothetical protein